MAKGKKKIYRGPKVTNANKVPRDHRKPKSAKVTKEVVKKVRKDYDPHNAVDDIIDEYDIIKKFRDKELQQAMNVSKPVSEADMNGREDFRDKLIFTIDGDDTKDIDDAISIEKVWGGYMLGVHIADVANYVQERSALDRCAIKRGCSVYLPDRVIPMLPKELSNGCCSLNEGEDRLALSCLMKIDKRGNIKSHRIVESVIHSAHKMTYNNVNAIIAKDKALREEYKDIAPIIDMAVELSHLLKEKRMERGAIEFDFPEMHIVVNESGNVTSLAPYERGEGQKLIEEFMLAANETVAKHFSEAGIPFLYRIHERPGEEKLTKLKHFAWKFGFNINGDYKNIEPKEVAKFVDDVSKSDAKDLLTKMALRSMSQARYCEDNEGHFGIAAKYYCHFTSPIRRYPDLQIHRIIKDTLRGRMTAEKKEHYRGLLPMIAESSSRYERRAVDCERDVDKLFMVRYMEQFVGETFNGVIGSVTEWGLYVELENGVEGLVHISTLLDDMYNFDPENYELCGARFNRHFAIGDKVKVVLESTDEIKRYINLELEEFYGKRGKKARR